MNNETNELLKEINKNIIENKLTPLEALRNGILSGLGAVLGATIILALLLGLLSQFVTVPVIGNYIKDIVDVVENR